MNQEKESKENNREFKAPDENRAPSERELPKEDIGYAVDVNRHYLMDRDLNYIKGFDTEYGGHLQDHKKALSKLAKNENLQNVDPDEYTEALAELAGYVSENHPDWELAGKETEEEKKQKDQHYKSGKSLWMHSMKKIYPEVNGSIADLLSLFEKGIGNAYRQDLTREQIKDLEKNNPQELIKALDEFIFFAQRDLKDSAFFNHFDESDPKIKEQNSAYLEINLRDLYKLQLIRDRLAEKIYGKAQDSPSDVKQIEQLQDQLNSSGKMETPNKEESLESSESKIVSLLESLANEEAKKEFDSRSRGNIFSQQKIPIIDAFISLYPDDKDLGSRLQELVNGIQENAQKLQEQGLQDKSLAFSRSAKESFESLFASEKSALEQAENKEKQRQQLRSKENAGFQGSSFVMPVKTMYLKLMEQIAKELS